MYDVLGYPADHPHRAIAAPVDREAARRSRTTRPIASPASRRSGTPRWSATRCSRSAATTRGRRRPTRASTGSKPLQVLDVKGDWAAQRPGRAARRLGVPVRQRALSRPRRHRRRRDGDGPRAATLQGRSRLSPRRSTRGARMDRRPAEQERRLGRLRRRQRPPLPQQHPVRRPRRAARSADRGRHRALRLDAGAARRRRADQRPALARGVDYLMRDAAAGRQLVRPLGHELHLRHLVGAVRAQRRRRRPRGADDAQGGRLAGRDPERGRRLGRGRRRATSSTTRGYEPAPSTPRRRPPGRCSA